MKAGGKVQAQHTICTNLLTFLTLWRVKKYTESHKYAKLAVTNVNELVAERSSRQITQLNLLGIVSMSLAAVEYKITGDNRVALRIVEQAWDQIEDHDTAVRPLLSKFITTLQKDLGPVSLTQLSSRQSYYNFAPQKADLSEPNYSFLKLDDSYGKIARNRPEVDKDMLVTKEFEEILFITVFVTFIGPNTPLIRTSELENARDSNEVRQTESLVLPSNSTPRPQRFASQSSTPRASLPKIEDKARNFQSVMQSMNRSKPQLAPRAAVLPPRMSKARMRSESRPYKSEVSTTKAKDGNELFKKVDEYTMSDMFRTERSSKQFHSEPRRRVGNSRPRQPRQNDSSRFVYMSPNLENSQMNTSFGMFKTQLTPLKARTQHRETIMLEFTTERESSTKRSRPPVRVPSKRNMSLQYSKKSIRPSIQRQRPSKSSFDSGSLLW
mmetsp:Transcript_19224/g.35199  ORF Transcript_19224/g.35199 Transcript_19224/m.35199 type:complete len:439 (-) Transcript_19224:560-1876(-)